MRAIVFDRFGDPPEVLQVRDSPEPQAGKGEVRVRMICSPVNPSDLSVVRGEYGRLPTLPATPGFEGAGIVLATGGGLLGKLRLGRRVAVLNGKGGNWQEQVVVPAKQVVPLPSEIPDEQAATFFVNPASALVMTQYILKVPPGGWLLQTAAGSALGRMVIRLGRHLGFHMKSLADGGRLLVYGTLSGEPLQLDPRDLMVGSRRVEGFWLSNWVRGQGIFTMLGLFRRIRKLMVAGIIQSEVAATFPMEEIQSAVREAAKPGRTGKVLLRLGK